MVDVEIKSLIARLNRFCTRHLEAAAGQCVSLTNYEVTAEHVLRSMVEDQSGDIHQILKHFEIDPGRVLKVLNGVIEQFKTGNASRPVFSPIMLQWFEHGWLLSSIDFGQAEIRSGILLLALMAHPTRLCSGDYIDLFEPINRLELKKKYATIIAASSETSKAQATGAAAPAGTGAPGVQGDGDALARFTINVTERARKGEIDPVFGRDREIRQMVDILARRRKNNPIAVGEAGVGKTAVVEGLALRIVEEDVPDSLKNVDILVLDMGLLQAGASVKGEFENRLKNVIQEVKASAKPIILFIDEAHVLIGAGGAAGGGDAANLLKPALARGELRTIAATTWSEYKKYFEKDAALARRFQLVKLDEPTDETVVTMLRGLRGRYEKAHGVIIRDEALVSAAELGSRYISGRQHPDKGVDLMDTSAARVKIALTTKPPELQDLERTIQTIERELKAHRRDQAQGTEGLEETIRENEEHIRKIQEEAKALNERWQKEKAAAQKVMDLRKKAGDNGEPEKPGKGAKAGKKEKPKKDDGKSRKELETALVELRELQGRDPLVPVDVTAEVVAKVVSDWTGVPVGKMVQDEAEALLKFEESLGKRIKGQNHVLDIVGKGIRAAKAGLKNPKTPIGVFLFVGPSGTGKTETGLGVADHLFGGERYMTTINMSEFQEKHTVSRLIGSPPGYVGYGEGGVLTEAVRQRPYTVVLLDEVEKADPEVLNLFYQVFDKGMLSDGEGREVSFKDSILFLTSNLATDIIMEACAGDARPPVEDLISTIRPVLSKHFKPALLARMTIVPFYPIGADAMKEIARLKLGQIQNRLHESHKISMDVDAALVDSIAERCTEVETGARNVDHILSGSLLPRISTEILQRMSEGAMPDRIKVGMDDRGEFTFAFPGK